MPLHFSSSNEPSPPTIFEKVCFGLFYDILIYSKDENSHKDHLEMVLQFLRENNLVANRKKCIFGQPQLEYLGHIIIGLVFLQIPGRSKTC